MNDYFLTLARYHVWATDVLLETVALMSDADYRKDAGLFFGSVHGTLNHLLAGEMHWHARIAEGAWLSHALDAQLESERCSLAQALRQSAARWPELVARLPPERYAGMLHYTRVNGQAMVTPFAATLGHVFNHGTHHRGQISAALTGMAYPCPEMDLVYMLLSDSAVKAEGIRQNQAVSS